MFVAVVVCRRFDQLPKLPQGVSTTHITFERDRLNIFRAMSRVFTSSGSTGGCGDAKTIISVITKHFVLWYSTIMCINSTVSIKKGRKWKRVASRFGSPSKKCRALKRAAIINYYNNISWCACIMFPVVYLVMCSCTLCYLFA